MRSLRYYEQQRLLAPQRTSGGQRLYSSSDVAVVERIQAFFHAGFCSSVIRDLLPALADPQRDPERLASAFEAATARLQSEKQSIENELHALQRLQIDAGLAPDARVRVHGREHDHSTAAASASFDHRDRRLR